VADHRIATEKALTFTANIPPFPRAVQRVMTMLRDHGIQLTKVAEVVALDQGLSGRVLKMANSAYFGLPRRVYNVTEALVLLGFANVRSVLISASVSNILYRKLAAYGLEAGSLWEHSVGAAYAAQMLARRIDARVYSMAFSAGLLHDVGKVAIDQALDPEARTTLANAIESLPGASHVSQPASAEGAMRPYGGHVPCARARHDPEAYWPSRDRVEIETVGVTHAEVGSQICRKWNLPEEMVEVVALHHHPAEAAANMRLSAIVAMADHCVNLLNWGRPVLTPSDFTWIPRGVPFPDQPVLDRLTNELPAMIASSRQLLEGTREVIAT
jgi:putative nucleotidyltransferase with HDIG domain